MKVKNGPKTIVYIKCKVSFLISLEVSHKTFSGLLCNIKTFPKNPKFYQTIPRSIPAHAVDLFTPAVVLPHINLTTGSEKEKNDH